MQNRDLELLLADVIDSVAATDRRVNSLTASLLALRAAFQELDRENRFEKLYAKHYVAQESEQLRQKLDGDVKLLLEVAKRLRKLS